MINFYSIALYNMHMLIIHIINISVEFRGLISYIIKF